MRVYFPATTRTLRELVDTGELGPPPLTGFAVTPQLRAWYRDSDLDELEYAALLEAARGSLRLLDQDPGARSRRARAGSRSRISWSSISGRGRS